MAFQVDEKYVELVDYEEISKHFKEAFVNDVFPHTYENKSFKNECVGVKPLTDKELLELDL